MKKKKKKKLTYLLEALKKRQYYFANFLPAEMTICVRIIEAQTLHAVHIKPASLLTPDATEAQHIQAIIMQLDRLLEGKYHQVKKELTQGIHTLFSDTTIVTAYIKKVYVCL